MSPFVNRADRPPAIGQVVVMAFEQDRKGLIALEGLDTVLIIKPNTKWPTSFYKFPGGMLRENETFTHAAVRELKEETGVIPSKDPGNLVELCRVSKQRHSPHSGEFDIVFFAAFGCDFTFVNDPLYGEVGDEAEEALVANFSDVARPGYVWPIATQSPKTAGLFGFHRELLEKALTELTA